MLENRESRERQYALAALAQQFGWSADRVLVIDEDQGLSGKASENRNGFQRLLSEVTLDHVGLVLGLEFSRLARSCKDGHHLVEVCAVFDTLLYDQDGVYDANDSNDRLLLGMQGGMSEFKFREDLQSGTKRVPRFFSAWMKGGRDLSTDVTESTEGSGGDGWFYLRICVFARL